MGSGTKTFFLSKPQGKTSSLRKLRSWEKHGTGFLIIENPGTGKMNLWEIDKRNWSLEYTLFIRRIETRRQTVQLVNFRGEIKKEIFYPDIEEIGSGKIFLQEI